MTPSEILEFLMILSFGISWPLSVWRSYKSRSTKGKSILFTLFIWAGYVCGILSKLLAHNYNLAFFMYFPNITFVTLDILLYFRNRSIEAREGKEK